MGGLSKFSALSSRLGGSLDQALQTDYEILAVQALDDITAKLIRRHGMKIPHSFLEWVNVSATARVGQLAQDFMNEPAQARHQGALAEQFIREVVQDWFFAQVKVRYPQLDLDLSHRQSQRKC